MLRRCRNWNYRGTGCYLITLVLNDRSKPLLGRLAVDRPKIELSELGRRIEAHFRRIPEFMPRIGVLGVQIMPEHLHGVLRVKGPLPRPLGEYLRGFKIGATKIARELGYPDINVGTRGRGLFADGFTDTILFDEIALSRAIEYLHDNPRRLWVKHLHPEFFTRLTDFAWLSANGNTLHFSAIGNCALLSAPTLVQVQCSRRDFAYARDDSGKIIRELPPRIKSALFADRCKDLLSAVAHGAVLVSPCISEGEREIVRLALQQGARVVILKNMGGSALAKPSGVLFDYCAQGRLLLLSPAGWPYLPGKKPMKRHDARVLNRIAQLLSGPGAAEIDYKGARLDEVDALVREVTLEETGHACR